MIVGVTTTPHGTVGGGLGRAQTVAVADVRDGEVIPGPRCPSAGATCTASARGHPPRPHRAVRARALLECVVTSGLGESMRTTMGKLGVVVRTDLTGDARAAAVLPPRPTSRTP